MIKTCFVLLLLICISGCVSSLPFQASLEKVERGMDRKEVAELLGPPVRRLPGPGDEEWKYIQSYSTEKQRIILIRFVEGRVSSQYSYFEALPDVPRR